MGLSDLGQEVGRVHIGLYLNDDPFNRGLTKASQSSATLGQRLRSASESLFYFGNAARMATDFIGGTISGMVELSNRGDSIKQTALSFERLAGGAAEAERWISAIQTASRGSLTDFEATNQSIQLMTMGLADSADEAGRFMELAAITKAINPELGSMENTITNIGLTLANDSWMRLDQLGVDATRLRARIEELKAEGMAMTEAFDVGVMEQIEENARKIGTDVLDIGKNSAEMQANWRELKDTAAQFGSAIMDDVAPHLNTAMVAAGQLLELMRLLAIGDWTPTINWPDPPDWLSDIQGWVSNQLAADVDKVNPRLAMTAEVAPGMTFEDLALAAEADRAAWNKNAELNALNALSPIGSAPMGMSMLPEPGGMSMMGAATPPQLRMQYGIPSRRSSGLYPMGQLTGGGLLTGSLGTGIAPDELRGFDPSIFRDPMGDFASSRGWASTMAGALPAPQLSDMMPAVDALGEFASTATHTRDTFGDIATHSQTIAGAIRDANAAAEFGSLEEKFGIAADSFDVDVFGAMQDALRGVEGAEESAARAMEIYQLQTGMATGASELFGGQMATLAQQLAEGKLSAEEYVNKVQELSATDFSNVSTAVQGMINDGDIEAAQRYLDILSQFPGVTGQGPEDMASQYADKFMPQGEEGDLEGAMSPFAPMLDELNEIDARMATVGDTWGGPIAELSQKTMASFADPALTSLGALDTKLTAMASSPTQLEVVLNIKDNPAMGSMLYNMMMAEGAARGETPVRGGPVP